MYFSENIILTPFAFSPESKVKKYCFLIKFNLLVRFIREQIIAIWQVFWLSSFLTAFPSFGQWLI